MDKFDLIKSLYIHASKERMKIERENIFLECL
jgi:hypothetical protein